MHMLDVMAAAQYAAARATCCAPHLINPDFYVTTHKITSYM